MAPIGEATVLKGQRSIMLIVSVADRIAGARSAFNRAVMGGRKIDAKFFWAAEAMVLSGGLVSKSVQSP